jgi:hypothetical protein
MKGKLARGFFKGRNQFLSLKLLSFSEAAMGGLFIKASEGD